VSVKNAVAHFGEIGQPASALKSLVFGGREPTAEEIAYVRATAEVNRVEARAAELEFRAIQADLSRRFGR